MGLRIKALLTAMIMLVILLPLSVQASEQPNVLITEIKLGGTVTGQPTEYVQIYNASQQSLDVSKFVLEYAKPAANMSDCGGDWKAQDATNVRSVNLTGSIPGQSNVVVEISMNDNAGGSLRLRNDSTVYDVVGWGKEGSMAKCSEADPAPAPSNAKSLKRYTDATNVIIDTNNNAKDFALNQDPLTGVFPVLSQNDANPNMDELECSVIEISEILPNPSGTDTGHEYIELHNPTSQAINLTGCSLGVGSSSKNLEGSISPSGYLVIYGLGLPNSAGGTVQIVSPTTEQAVTYPPDLADDEAWADVGGTWQVTNQSTPNTANKLSVVNVSVAATTSLAACPAGKYRNPETNRCKNYVTVSIKPCSAGQVRNPETNRCRKLTAAALTSLKPCSAGQVRNPATNRCKKNVVTALMACKEGQERNPETNRCRKVAGASTETQSTGNSKPQQTSKMNYGIFAVLALAAGGYGIYEYRGEIGAYLSRLKSSLKK